MAELHVPSSSKHALGHLGVLLNSCSVLQLDPPAWLFVPSSSPSSVKSDTDMPWRQSLVETQVLQAALQDMPTGILKPAYQLCKNKPEAHIHASYWETSTPGSRK